MFAMSIRELLTYLSSLPPETKFPIGFSGPFIINNVVDQIIFRPRLNTSAIEMQEELSELLGLELRSSTGGRSIIQADTCYAYFGIDEHSVITPMNLVFLTILRSMKEPDMAITVNYRHGDIIPEAKYTFKVPGIWWMTLSKRHQRMLALEYLSNKVLGGFKFSVDDRHVVPREKDTELVVQDVFGNWIADLD